jgi:predicted transposase/invertase (TIGR01784 family)
MEKNNTSTATSDAQEAMESIQVPTSGRLVIPMTNDYLFRALLEKNNAVLCEMIRDLLHLDVSETVMATIKNPIEPGQTIDEKEFILDILAEINGSFLVNIEMQVINTRNWVERSLSYLCRNYDRIERGEDYFVAKPVYQIGLLNFTLFEDDQEFYSTYRMLNEKTHRPYGDKLCVKVLDLNRVDLATEEDRLYKIDYWARLFKATSWEEIHMLTENKPIITEAAKTVYSLTQDEEFRLRCEAREDYYRTQNDVKHYYERQIDSLKKENEEKDKLIAELQAKLNGK